HDASEIWADDEMEVFIDPAGERKSYYQIIVNAGGVSWDAFHAAPGQPDTSWEPKYQYKVGVGPRSWILELALPWSIFDRTTKANTEWAFNALIHRRRDAEWLYWSPVFNRTAHTPQNFGELVGMPAKRNVTGWRGDGTGRYAGAAPPLEWSSKENIAWHAEVGYGFSSPVIVGKKVFITAEPNELICLDAATGKNLWKRMNGAKDLPEELQNRDLEPPTECGYASPTPCSDGEHVYALFGSGVVACYDMEGKRKWIRLIEIEPRESNGRSASPVLAGHRLLVHVSDLFCLDAKTGKTVWQKEAEPGFGTLAVVKVGDANVALTPMGDAFRVIDGKKLAGEFAVLEVPSPVIEDGVAYYIGGKAKAVKFVVTPSGVVDGSKTTAETVTPTKTLWETDLDGEFYASPVIHDGLVHSVSKQGDYVVLDAKTGQKLASKKLEIDSEFGPSLSLAGGKLFVQSDSGVTLILEPGRAFKLLHKNDLGDGSVATPSFDGERIFIRGEEKLWCVGAGGVGVTALAGSEGGHTAAEAVTPTTTVKVTKGGHYLPVRGWRGNGTGRFPDSSPPLEWGKVSRLMSGLRCSAARPKGDSAEGTSAFWGAVTEWLVLGPLPAEEGKGIEKEFFKEAESQPSIDEKVTGIAWRLHKSDANMIDLARVLGKDARGVAYAHSYLWSETGGKVLIRFSHYWRLKAWFNGEAVEPKNKVFRTDLKKGWNRLLCKVDWAPQKGQYQIYPSLWHLGVSIEAIPPHETVTENIVWQTRLPDWSISSPLIVGEHIYVMSEPNDLVCLDKADGRILWVRSNHFFDTLSDDEKGSPAFAKIAPKAARLREINDSFRQRWPDKTALKERSGLQTGIRKLMAKADKEKYARNWQEMHGYSVPTPVSDGTDIYVWIAYGIGAR
ncbi:MAG: PQQ-binding-like beta-propeller repeat protein, partial [Planctomycetota bacterium]|nr:PQQ-binding-like beta-propeller repeat protein [Planctomycetota bacterium]